MSLGTQDPYKWRLGKGDCSVMRLCIGIFLCLPPLLINNKINFKKKKSLLLSVFSQPAKCESSALYHSCQVPECLPSLMFFLWWEGPVRSPLGRKSAFVQVWLLTGLCDIWIKVIHLHTDPYLVEPGFKFLLRKKRKLSHILAIYYGMLLLKNTMYTYLHYTFCINTIYHKL